MQQLKESVRTAAVIGMGPVGQILAAHLREAGLQVAVCDVDKARMHVIRREGVRLEGAIAKHATFEHVVASVRDLPALAPEAVFVSVKAYHVPGMIREMDAFPREGVAYISAQNGIDTEAALAQAFRESNTFRMVINYAGNQSAPNATTVNFFTPPNYIGSLDDSQPETARRVAEILSGVRLDTVACDSFEIARRVWEKTILNSSLSALCGVANMTMRDVMAQPEMVAVVEQVIRESVAVAAAENIRFDENFLRRCMRYLRRAGGHFPSLAVDLLHKRPTEIDFFNGKFVEYGKKHYIPTPMNLAFTNVVKGMTQKNAAAAPAAPIVVREPIAAPANGAEEKFYLGVDLGSSYTKIAVINGERAVLHKEVVKTLSRDKKPLYAALDAAHARFDIAATCAAGYGREQFPDADLTKTEIHCAARAAYQLTRSACNVIDIGAEDIKIIHVGADGTVADFFMNSKCAAGTGAFLTEMAEKIEIPVEEMSNLAALSGAAKELNSFCTVFAKTEVMKWSFDQTPLEDIARGIYLSLANRIHKLKTDPLLPVVLAGGVIAYHPYLQNLLEERFGKPVATLVNPQYCVAYGAALYAQRHAATRTNGAAAMAQSINEKLP